MEGAPYSVARRYERRPARIPVSLRLASGSRVFTFAASTLDISQVGVGIRGDVAIVPGQRVDLILFKGPTVTLPSRVVWVRATEPGGELHAGLEFATPLPADA